jgi:hypothetical protein
MAAWDDGPTAGTPTAATGPPGLPAATLAAVGTALGARLGQLAAALDRHDAFVFGPERPAPAHGAGEDPAEARLAAATALVLRALRCVGDPAGWQVITHLADTTCTTGELAGLLRVPRLVAWEQVNDLIQAGLAVRALDGDAIAVTPAGLGLAALVRTLAAAAAAHRGGPR